ncbi:hypothetical protein FRC02_003356 [Tulasnella sp. 418]|nr:hypothetical protein FRC02_003356 [Tulasnella sp. 418]
MQFGLNSLDNIKPTNDRGRQQTSSFPILVQLDMAHRSGKDAFRSLFYYQNGFDVYEINGYSFEEIFKSLSKMKVISDHQYKDCITALQMGYNMNWRGHVVSSENWQVIISI